jgi:serine/threonine protein kinase
MHCPYLGPGRRHILDSNLPVAEGSFCLVYILLLCDIHYSRASVCDCKNSRQVVCKTPRTDNEQIRQHFDTEIEALTLLRDFSHPNIINYLGSYQMEDKLGILLPMAECDLDAYMSLSLIPGWGHFEWVLRQLSGIASALDHLHTGLKSAKNKLGSAVSFNRHGDLKPSNILIFHNQPDAGSEGNYDHCGTWVLSDFGISRIKHNDKLESESGSDTPESSAGDQTIPGVGDLGDRQYVAPETEIHQCLSSASDIWSLGCVMLEVLVWLMYGHKGRQGFLLDLGSDKDGREPFWFVTDSDQIKLKPAIFTWMERLEGKTRKKKAFRPILDLLQRGRVLDPDPKRRATAATVKDELQHLWQHASKDKEGSDHEVDLFGAHFTSIPKQVPPLESEVVTQATLSVDIENSSNPKDEVTTTKNDISTMEPSVKSEDEPEEHTAEYPDVQQGTTGTDNSGHVSSMSDKSSYLTNGMSVSQGNGPKLESATSSTLPFNIVSEKVLHTYNDENQQEKTPKTNSTAQTSQSLLSPTPPKLARVTKDRTKQLTSELTRWSVGFCQKSQERKSNLAHDVPLLRVTSDHVNGASNTELSSRVSRSLVRTPSVGGCRKRSRSESRNRRSDSDPSTSEQSSQLRTRLEAPIRMRSGGVRRDFSYFKQRFLDTK